MNSESKNSDGGGETPVNVNGDAGVDLRRGPRALAQDPFSTDDILAGFYRPQRVGVVPPSVHLHPDDTTAVDPDPDPPEAAAASVKAKPTHYKIVCISLYTEDIARLEAMVAELKRRGHTKANKSQLIRCALEQLDLNKVPKSG